MAEYILETDEDRISYGNRTYPLPVVVFRDGDDEILRVPMQDWAEIEFAIENGAYTDTGEYVYFPDVPGTVMEREDFYALRGWVVKD